MIGTTLTPETVPALLAAQQGSGTALIYRGRTRSCSELDELSRRVFGGLAARGIGPGDRVGIWLPNCPAYVPLCFACAPLGAVAVAVSTRYRGVEVEDIVGRARCKALASWPGFRGIDFSGILRAVDPAVLGHLAFLILYEEAEVRALGLPTTESANGTKIQRGKLREWPQRRLDRAAGGGGR